MVVFQSANARLLLCDPTNRLQFTDTYLFQSAKARLLLCDGEVMTGILISLGFNPLKRVFFSASWMYELVSLMLFMFQSAKARLLLCDRLAFIECQNDVLFQSAKARLLLCDQEVKSGSCRKR